MVRAIIDIYILILIVDVIVSYLPQFKTHPVSVRVKQVSNFTCDPIRRLIPENDIPFDISPMIVILALKLFVAMF